MKVVLIKDVKGVGKAHEAVEQKDGYALNYLIPNKLAIAATPGALSQAQLRQKQAADKGAVDAQLLAQNIATLAEAKIVLRAKANEKEHLYDAIGEADILSAIKTQTNIDLPEGSLKLEKPIKELGVHEVAVAAGETSGNFSVTVEAE